MSKPNHAGSNFYITSDINGTIFSMIGKINYFLKPSFIEPKSAYEKATELYFMCSNNKCSQDMLWAQLFNYGIKQGSPFEVYLRKIKICMNPSERKVEFDDLTDDKKEKLRIKIDTNEKRFNIMVTMFMEIMLVYGNDNIDMFISIIEQASNLCLFNQLLILLIKYERSKDDVYLDEIVSILNKIIGDDLSLTYNVLCKCLDMIVYMDKSVQVGEFKFRYKVLYNYLKKDNIAKVLYTKYEISKQSK